MTRRALFSRPSGVVAGAVKDEADKLLNFLAGMPSGNCTASSNKVVREVMLQTGGQMLACGYLWDIKSKSLGGGVYKLTLSRDMSPGEVPVAKSSSSPSRETHGVSEPFDVPRVTF
jgi:hypothetical protein